MTLATQLQPSAEGANDVELYRHSCIRFHGILDDLTVTRSVAICSLIHLARPYHQHVIFYSLHNSGRLLWMFFPL